MRIGSGGLVVTQQPQSFRRWRLTMCMSCRLYINPKQGFLMATSQHTNTNTLDIETFTIKPNDAHRVLLDTFSSNDRAPQFHIIYHDRHPESPTVVSYHDASIPQAGGDYRLHRQFQSYSQLTHRITVRFRTATDKELCRRVAFSSSEQLATIQ
jgi:hypothetical protein